MLRVLGGAVALATTLAAGVARAADIALLHGAGAGQQLQLDRPLSRRQPRLPVGQHHPQSDQSVRHRRRRAGRLQLADRPVRVRRRSRHHRSPAPTIRSRRGNSPIRGSARCAAASATRSTTSCVYATGGFAFGGGQLEVVRPDGAPDPSRLDRRRRRRGRHDANWSARVEYLFVNLAERALHDDRHQQRLRVEPAAPRRELPLLSRRSMTAKLPGSASRHFLGDGTRTARSAFSPR